MKVSRAWNATLLSMALPAAALAHDFWIEPETFRPAPRSSLKVGLRVGEEFVGEAVKRDGDKIRKFVVVGPSGEAPIAGMDGTDPAGMLRVAAPGIYVIGYRSNHSFVELPAEKFENYLVYEGLRNVSEFRRRHGENDKPGREIYSRCAKALVGAEEPSSPRFPRNPLIAPKSETFTTASSETGQGAREALTQSIGFDLNLGFTLEIVPVNNPLDLKAGDELKVRVFFEGAPVEDGLVTFMNKNSPEDGKAKRTDKDGVASHRLDKSGVWLVRCVHMIRSSDPSLADWESFWASLTFEVAAGASSAP